MKVSYKVVFLFCLVSVLNACALGPPTQEELASGDYGSPVSQERAQRLAKEFLSRQLKDPYSAQYEWNRVYRG